MDVDDEEDESMHMVMMSWSLGMGMIPAITPLGSDESLLFGEGVGALGLFFNIFFNVEFQKFFISLSVLPGRRAAIWDHLNCLKQMKVIKKLQTMYINYKRRVLLYFY